MKSMRSLVFVLMLLLLGGIVGLSPTAFQSNMLTVPDCYGEDSVVYEYVSEEDDNSEYDRAGTICAGYDWTPPTVPLFIKRLFSDGDWSADTICVVNDKAYYLAEDGYNRTNVVYCEDGILAKDPTLNILPYNKEKKLFNVSIVGKDFLIDFSDRNSLKQLSVLTEPLPAFTPFRYNSTADFCERVFYNIEVDFPKKTVNHCETITKWLIRKIEDSQNSHAEVSPLSTIYIGYAKMSNTGWHYDGDIHNYKSICKFASDVYYAIVKGEYSMSEIDYPALFSNLCLKAYVNNSRFVTYQQYTHGCYGGAHGYYTEQLLSYDHVHKQEIDYKYLFKEDCMEKIIALLKEDARKSSKYQIWSPDIEQYTSVKDENDEFTGRHRLPHLGLSDDGIVFSFQPYEISCFAAGSFHFTIPYCKLRPYFTDQALWCLKGML